MKSSIDVKFCSLNSFVRHASSYHCKKFTIASIMKSGISPNTQNTITYKIFNKNFTISKYKYKSITFTRYIQEITLQNKALMF
jgi:hypothetical protein